MLLGLLFALAHQESVTVMPVEYAGYLNNCSLYFSPSPAPTATLEQAFLQCHYRTCVDYYLTNCDEEQLERSQSLAECRQQCCHSNSNTTSSPGTVLEWLEQCQLDYLKYSNERMKEQNRLPFIVLAWTFGSITVVVVAILCCIYSEEWMEWVRRRLQTRNIEDNHDGMELPIIR